MGKFARSKEIAKKSFEIMKKEKELFAFPILSIIFSAIFILAISVPFLATSLLNELTPSFEFDVLFYSILFFMYLGLAFIATFFNVCTVYTAAQAFSNNNPTFKGTINYTLSKAHLILMWSIVSATVGLFLFLLERIAEKSKGVGKVLLLVTRFIFGLAWGLATIFVIPVMVYKNLGPFAAIKESIKTLKKTWGEYIIKGIGVFFIFFVYVFVGILIFIPIAILTFQIHIFAFALSVITLVIYITIVSIMFGIFEKIFDTALYVYAETGAEVGGFNKELLENAFKQKKKNSLLSTI